MSPAAKKNASLNIALVSDFFCPNAGGVETHIYFLAQCLRGAGHRVIVITHGYGRRRGIRVLSNGLKVYYLPFIVVYNGNSIPTVIGAMPWYRRILLRERIQIVHGHSTFSTMAHESMFVAWQLGIRTVFTDHSLFGFADASAILTNSLVLRYCLSTTNKVICVSYTSKENTVLRGDLDPARVCTIPNAIHAAIFTPDPAQFYRNPTTVVFLGRLVYRKGADLLCDILPRICWRYPHVRFLIGGDGPKRVEIEEQLERYDLQMRVRMLGMLPHDRVRDVLVQGQIFINTSLTEAFCMSIVEAAACGLHVVSTRVGGIPEVLPPEYISLSDPVSSDLERALCEAIERRQRGELPDPLEKHESVKKMYNWSDVATRTEVVYQEAMTHPRLTWRAGLTRYRDSGLWFGIVYIIAACACMVFLTILDYFDPVETLPETTTNSPPRSSCLPPPSLAAEKRAAPPAKTARLAGRKRRAN